MNIEDGMKTNQNDDSNQSSNDQLKVKINILKNNELFKNISQEKLEWLAKSSEVVKAPIGLPLASREKKKSKDSCDYSRRS